MRGGLVFGVGFGVCGTCAAPAVAMVGTGHLVSLATVAGLFGGIALRDAWVARATAAASSRADAPLGSVPSSPEVPAGTAIGL